MAALATMMQTPRPPCSAPHRPSPRGRRGPGEFLRPRASRGPTGSRAPLSRGPRGCVDPGGRSPGTPCCFFRGDPFPRSPLGRDPSPRTPLGAGIRRVCAPAPGSPARPAAGSPGSHPLPPAPRGPESRPPQPESRPRGSDPRESPLPAAPPGSRRGVRAPAAGVRGTPGGMPGSRPGGLAPGSLPYGLLGRASRRGGSLICASDVSRCALITGTRR